MKKFIINYQKYTRKPGGGIQSWGSHYPEFYFAGEQKHRTHGFSSIVKNKIWKRHAYKGGKNPRQEVQRIVNGAMVPETDNTPGYTHTNRCVAVELLELLPFMTLKEALEVAKIMKLN